MRRSERRQIKRAVVLIKVGDRTAALALLRSLVYSVVAAGQGSQLALPLVLDAAFDCPRLQGTMRVKDCLTRRTRAWPSGKGKGTPTDMAYPCEGCEVGATLAGQLPHYEPPPNTIPRATGGHHAT